MQSYFYPRPPRGGRLFLDEFDHIIKEFLSTPSARRATGRRSAVDQRQRDFYPRPPRGGRLTGNVDLNHAYKFLSTPSARRATKAEAVCLSASSHFYPRPPRGGRQQRHVGASDLVFISIHALREEGDLVGGFKLIRHPKFLSTPSARRATGCRRSTFSAVHDFYPRPPRGGRP